MTGMIV